MWVKCIKRPMRVGIATFRWAWYAVDERENVICQTPVAYGDYC